MAASIEENTHLEVSGVLPRIRRLRARISAGQFACRWERPYSEAKRSLAGTLDALEAALWEAEREMVIERERYASVADLFC